MASPPLKILFAWNMIMLNEKSFIRRLRTLYTGCASFHKVRDDEV
jgi:hypothetical protein